MTKGWTTKLHITNYTAQKFSAIVIIILQQLDNDYIIFVFVVYANGMRAYNENTHIVTHAGVTITIGPISNKTSIWVELSKKIEIKIDTKPVHEQIYM